MNKEPSTMYCCYSRQIDVLEPDSFEVDLDDVYRALPKINRFNGQTRYPYSVARHSINCLIFAQSCGLVSRDGQLAVLFHDAAEAYIGDIVRPIKQEFNGSLAVIEQAILDNVYRALDVKAEIVGTEVFRAFVRRIDTILAATEIDALLGMPEPPLKDIKRVPPEAGIAFPQHTWLEDELEFRALAEHLLKGGCTRE